MLSPQSPGVLRDHGQLLKPPEEPDSLQRPMFGDSKQLKMEGGLLRPVSGILCTQNITIVNGRFAPKVPGLAFVFCAANIFLWQRALGFPHTDAGQF